MKIFLRLAALLPLILLTSCGAKWFPEAGPIESPATFVFPDATPQPAITALATSGSVQATEFTGAAQVTVTNGEYEINGNGIWKAPADPAGSIVAGDKIRVRHNAAIAPSTRVITTLQAGSTTSTFQSTTTSGTAFNFPTGIAAGTSTQSSVPVNGIGISSVAATITQTNSSGLVSTDGINFSGSVSVAPGGTLYVRHLTPAAGATAATTVQVTGTSNGGAFPTVTGTFTTTTPP
jgi:hypothetical protein